MTTFIDESPERFLNPQIESVYVEAEGRAMKLLLAGDDPVVEQLRTQWTHSTIKGRSFTGKDCRTTFEVPVQFRVATSRSNFQLRDVEARISGAVVYFVLTISDGAIATLAAYTEGREWPVNPQLENVGYKGKSEEFADTRKPNSVRKSVYGWTERHPLVTGIFLAAFTILNAQSAIEMAGKSRFQAGQDALWAAAGLVALALHIREVVRNRSRSNL